MLFPIGETEELIRILETDTLRHTPTEAILSVLALLHFLVEYEMADTPTRIEPGAYPVAFDDDAALVNLRAIAVSVRQSSQIPDTVNWSKMVSWCIGLQMRLVPYLFPRTNGV